ncbi:hypothetical protein B0H16DRAFT_1713170 [Mycena metata]|uniref:ER transporter 6TM N-terminal domain-containing protein n=1 Tax=Mycena metata TaxID=1033252 RepID=A0AAD7K2A4_9AGAR|nr:hypothetical protein B0H16DRAFT_1713170 [Mycena metata]
MAELEPKASPGIESTLESRQPSVQKPASHSVLSLFPLWVSGPLKSPQAWKVLLRCWIAVFASFVILLPNASLRTVGTTSFFALLTSLFLPPYLPVQFTFFLLSTLMLGLLAGWGIGIGAMRAANAVRNQAHIAAVAQQIEASIKANPVFQANPALAQTTAVFAGLFLDIRATAVYGGFLAIGAFIFGLIRAYAPKLLFMSIFGTIAVDIFCSIGPLFPTKRYTLLNSTAISVGCYMGIAVLTTVFVFPETMSHAMMNKLVQQLARVQKMLEMQDDVFAAPPEALVPTAPLIVQFRALRTLVITTQQQVASSSGFLSLEFSWGKWNGDDVRSLEDPTVTLITRVSSLLNFDRLAGTSLLGPLSDLPPSSTSVASTAHTTPAGLADTRWHETHLLRTIHTQNIALEAQHSVRPAHVFPLLDTATRDLRFAIINALTAVRGGIANANGARWRRNAARDAESAQKLDEAGVGLAEAVREFKAERRLELLAPFLPLLDAAAAASTKINDSEKSPLGLRSLFVSYVFVSNIISIAEAVEQLLGAVQAISEKRRRARLWAPTSLRAVWKVVSARGDRVDAAFGEDTSPPVGDLGGGEREYRRDPDSRPPTNALQKVMHLLHHGYLWTSTPEAIFTFKYVFISIALWLPAVFVRSAHFYYFEKGIWALIMAQTTLNITAGDQIWNYITRLGGTLVGLVLGLIAWYAGNGSGTGNRYGAAAAFGVFVFPLIFLRIFAPERYLAGNVMCCATFALVVGYSWIDGHTVQFATPGIGWSVAWKRWALVVTGCAASFVVMMLPPTSGRKAVRTRNARSIAALSNFYGFLISTWIGAREEDAQLKPGVAPPAWTGEFRAQLMALAEEMTTIRELTNLARWEGSIRGKWPAEEYTKLVDVQIDMITSLGALGTSLGHLETGWRVMFLHNSKVLNPNFIADVMAVFSLISQSLRTGEPMHQVIPMNLLDRLFYHDAHGHARTPLVPPEGSNGQPVDVEGIKSVSYMYYASSIVAVYQLLRSLDELHVITKDLCGEIPLRGFLGWREEYDRTHAPV